MTVPSALSSLPYILNEIFFKEGVQGKPEMSDEIGKMDAKCFEETLFSFIERGFEKIPANTFFEVLALLDEKEQEEVIEIEGEIVGGKLFLSVPTTTVAPIDAKDNSCRI